jgi:hypothetical protein
MPLGISILSYHSEKLRYNGHRNMEVKLHSRRLAKIRTGQGTIMNQTLSDKSTLPLTLKLIALTLFLPEELSFYVGTLRLTSTRLIFLALAPILVIRYCKMWATGRTPVLVTDILVVITSIWMISAVAIVVDINEALAHTTPDVLEFCMAYFSARVLLSEHGQAATLVNFLTFVIAIVGLIGLLDSVTGQYFSHEMFSKLTGYVKPRQHDYRYGFLRASSTLEHPIHFGMICSFGLVLAVGTSIRARAFKILACSVGLIASISSAPMQSAFMGICLTIYDRTLVQFRLRWLLLNSAAALAFFVILLTVNSPINFINEHLIFDSSSGWYRVWEWQTALEVLNQSPWFGIAYSWSLIAERTGVVDSIDSLWLYTALTYGYPGGILLGLTFISAALCRTSGPKVNLTAQESKLGKTITIIIFLVIFLGFTVHFWASAWIFISLLTGVKAHLGALGTERYAAPREIARRLNRKKRSLPATI